MQPTVKSRRLARQNQALFALSRRNLLQEGRIAGLQEIVDVAAATLEVERVGIWLYDRERVRIHCTVLHQDSRPNGFDELDAETYPEYFAALSSHLVLDARNALQDPRTAVLLPSYLRPLGICSMLDAPIFVSGEMIGIVCHESLSRRRAWTEDEQRFACQIADLAGLLFETSERRRAEGMTQALLEVARDVSGALELDDILARTMREVAALLGCEAVAIARIDPRSREGRLVAQHGLDAELAAAAAKLVFTDAQPLAVAVRRGETVVLRDMASQAMVSPETAQRFRLRSVVVAPLRARERYFGSLVAIHQGERPFDAREVEFCTAVAAQVAGAMDVAELYRHEREDAELSAALLRVSREMNSDLSAEVLLRRLCQRTVELVGGDRSHVCLFEENGERRLAAVAGYSNGVIESIAPRRARRVFREDVAAALAVLDRDGVLRVAAGLPGERLLEPLLRELGYRTAMAVPLRHGAEPIGVHLVGSADQAQRFDDAQERLLRGIAEIASLAFGNARLVEQLERANAVKSEFVNAVSHELRTPLHVILGYTEMLLEEAEGVMPTPQREVLLRIDAQSRGLFQLISSTLDLGRLETGRMSIEPRDCDLRGLLEEMAAETRTLLERRKRGLAFSLEIEDAPERLHTDPEKLRVVLRNLLENAVKFTETGSVRLACARLGPWLELAVEDSGIGIAPAFQTSIFESFQQGDAAASVRAGGVGLGLYVVRRLVELLGGEVRLASEIGKGSCFTVRLPLEAPVAES